MQADPVFDLNCNQTFGGGCLLYERLTVSVLSAVASLGLGILLLRNALQGAQGCSKNGVDCEPVWSKLHHYALFFLCCADFLVALNFAVVREASHALH